MSRRTSHRASAAGQTRAAEGVAPLYEERRFLPDLSAGPGSPDPAVILGRARKRGRKRRHEWTPRVNSSPPPLGKLADVWPQGGS